MKAKLLCFRVGKVNATERRNFQRELYGYKDFSNKGKYFYEREGLVQKTKSIRMDSAILATQVNAPKIVKLLKKYKAKVQVLNIVIKKEVF